MHTRSSQHARTRAHRGFVLIASVLLLAVVTLLALAMFRSLGLDEKIGGNVREKGRALEAAQSALQYAEFWLTSNSTTTVVACATPVVSANAGAGQVCTNALAATAVNGVTSVPWTSATGPIGVSYVPPGMVVNAAAGAGTYYANPMFYISLIGPAANGLGNAYRIDAVGYGGTPDSVAVVESVFEVGASVQDLTQP